MSDRKEFETAVRAATPLSNIMDVDITGAYRDAELRLVEFGWDLARRIPPQAPFHQPPSAPPPTGNPAPLLIPALHYVLTPNGPETASLILDHRKKLHAALQALVDATDPYANQVASERLAARADAIALLKAIKP